MDTLSKVVSQAIDYRSPGNEQAAAVIRTLRENSLMKEDVLTTEMQEILASAIDKYQQLLPTGYVRSSLDAVVIGLLTTWNVLGASKDGDPEEATPI